MESDIKVGQRFKFNLSSDILSPERRAVVTRVLSNREEGLGPEVDYYLAYWVEAYELPETEVLTTLVFERGIDGNVYLDGRVVYPTLSQIARKDGPPAIFPFRKPHLSQNSRKDGPPNPEEWQNFLPT